MIKLYDFSLSPRARKVRITLEAKGLAYEKVPIDITKGEQKTPEYLAINPYGKVPRASGQWDNGLRVHHYYGILERHLPYPAVAAGRCRTTRPAPAFLMHYADNRMSTP